MKLFSITSSLHSEVMKSPTEEPFIKHIEECLWQAFEPCDDFHKYCSDDSLIYVRTGGTEGIFRSLFTRNGELKIKGSAPVRLLSSGQSNSLAASMEIISFLRQKGFRGQILHGTAEDISLSLKNPPVRQETTRTVPFTDFGILAGKRYGVIGMPSDWLISSDVDYFQAKQVLGCELLDIPIGELIDLINEGGATIPQKLAKAGEPKFGRPFKQEHLQKAADVLQAIRRIIAKYSLDGFTLRCFDLLSEVGGTGCYALAELNSEGFIATCEGDIPAMLSMAICREKTGHSGFQVNLSRVRGDSLLFAHCTIPFDMTSKYCFDTHFESGIGVAIHGELPERVPAKIYKLGSDLERCYIQDIEIISNQYEDNLCRTQIWVQAPGLKDYMLNEPLGNHHIIML